MAKYIGTSGLSAEVADALRDEMMPRLQRYKKDSEASALCEHCFMCRVSKGDKRRVSGEDLKRKAQQLAAKLLDVEVDAVKRRKEYIAVYNKMDSPYVVHPHERYKDTILVMLALGPLDRQVQIEGIPIQSLPSGEMLAFRLNRTHIYTGRGEGLAYLWTYRRAGIEDVPVKEEAGLED